MKTALVLVILAAPLGVQGQGVIFDVRPSLDGMRPALATPRPIITPDANTVAHLWFKAGGLTDSRGNAWSVVGSVPYVPRSGRAPGGAGSFGAGAYYYLPAGSTLAFAGDFSACFVFRQNTLAGTLFSNLSTAGGWGVWYDWSWYGNAVLNLRNATANTTVGGLRTDKLGVDRISVVCAGRSGNVWRVKTNLVGPEETLTSSTAYVQNLTAIAGIGIPGTGDHGGYLNGTVFEAWFSTTAASDALFTSIQQEVKRKLGITAW